MPKTHLIPYWLLKYRGDTAKKKAEWFRDFRLFSKISIKFQGSPASASDKNDEKREEYHYPNMDLVIKNKTDGAKRQPRPV